MTGTYDVTFGRQIRKRTDRKRPFELRWEVAGLPKSKSFTTRTLADNHRAKLMAAARAGEEFETVTGEPLSWIKVEEAPKERPITWFAHSCAYIEMKWPHIAARNRVSLADALATVTPALVVEGAEPRPSVQDLRTALYKWAYNPSRDQSDRPAETKAAVRWLVDNSLSVADLANPAVIRKALGALSLTMSGEAAAAATFQRKRAVFYNALGYAVELGLLESNPVDKVQWTPEKVADQVDRRVVANPKQFTALLDAVRRHEPRGRHFAAFFGCMYYGAMRPSEVTRLALNDCDLPERGWGMIELGQSAPYAGTAWTDSGEAHEERQLKARSVTAIRQVPIPPVLVSLIRNHVEEFGTDKTGRLFRAARGGYVSPAEYGKVWQAARNTALTLRQAASPLAKRPYDLRHGGVSLWLNSGVSPTVVAKRAGHSVAVLLSVYAGCLDGEDDVANERIEATLASYDLDESNSESNGDA